MDTPTLRPLYGQLLLMALASKVLTLGATSQPPPTPQELLDGALYQYNHLQRYECRGTVKTVQQGRNRVMGSDSDGSLYTDTSPVTTIANFHFSYARDGKISLQFYTVKTESADKDPQAVHRSRNENLCEVFTNDKGEFELFYSGKLQHTANTLDELADRGRFHTRQLLPFLLDLLEPTRSYKFTGEPVKRTWVQTINRRKFPGIQYRATTRKWLWIDPNSQLIRRAKCLNSHKSRKREMAFLQQELKKLKNSDIERGQQIAREIDALEKQGYMSVRYYYDFEYQSFDNAVEKSRQLMPKPVL